MNIERIDGQRGVTLHETIEIDVGNNVARRAAVCILEDSVEISVNGDGGPSEAMEDGHLKLRVVVVGLRHLLEEGGEEVDQFGHHVRSL